MLAHVLKTHFEKGASLARDRTGLGQRMPHGYAIMQTKEKKLYWVNESNESSEPIATNDARLIRRMALKHRDRNEKIGMERSKR